MSLRFFIVGIVWVAVMVLLFVTPVPSDHMMYFHIIPARSLMQALFYWGFVHMWIVALKKQMKYEEIRRKAIALVTVTAVLSIVLVEGLLYWNHTPHQHPFANILFDLTGATAGLLTFRLLYAGFY